MYKNILIIFILFLVGCSHFQPQHFQYIPWQTRQAKLQHHETWNINGSISVTYNKHRDIAYFEWVQNQDGYKINISGPMNLKSVRITGDVDKVEFCRSNNQCVKDKSSKKLFFNQFGWQLPVSNIKYWILARPVPGKIKAKQFDQYGHLVAFEQQDWKINYFDFKAVSDVDLPRIMQLRNKNIFIKVIIKNISL